MRAVFGAREWRSFGCLNTGASARVIPKTSVGKIDKKVLREALASDELVVQRQDSVGDDRLTEVTDEGGGSISTQAERSALSDQKMFEVAIELVNERGTAKTTLKDIGERRVTAEDWRAIDLDPKTGCGWSCSLASMTCGKSIYRAYLRTSGTRRADSGHGGAARYFFARVGLPQGNVYSCGTSPWGVNRISAPALLDTM